MEIIHLVLGKANPCRMNGVNKVVNELATRQVISGATVEVWGITNNPVHDYPPRNYTTQLFQALKNPFSLSLELKNAIRIRQGNVVFHLHGGFIPAMYSVALLLKKHDIPLVFTPHGSYNTIALHKNGLTKRIYFSLFEKRLLAAATHIHCLGKSEVSGLNAIYPNNKAVLIPYGFEIPGPTRSVAAAATPFIIGFCGRIDIYTKGLRELMRGFMLFNRRYPESQLWIIGDGAERAKLEKMARYWGIDHAIVFYGSRYNEEKNNLLQQCHVFAAPSRNEGLPTAVLEAAALGVPCLVSEATNTGDMIRQYDAGYVIQTTDEFLVYHAIVHLYERIVEQKGLAVLKQHSRQMVSEAFNWNTIVSKFLPLYTAA